MQVKHTSAGDSVKEIAESIGASLRSIFGDELEFLSVIYSTQAAGPRNIPESSIFFNRPGLLEYTLSYGNLKSLTTNKIFW